jgi:hypothetical protein
MISACRYRRSDIILCELREPADAAAPEYLGWAPGVWERAPDDLKDGCGPAIIWKVEQNSLRWTRCIALRLTATSAKNF